MTRRLAALVVTGVAALGAVGGLTVGPAAAGSEETGDGEGRVLVISLPELTWDDVNEAQPPNLLALLDDSAVADLATRTISRHSTLADGYTTLNAGTRAVGAGGSLDGQAFGVNERYGADSAGDVFARRTGESVAAGIVSLAIPEVLAQNDDEPYDAEVGALADALDEAGYRRAVIANADGDDQNAFDEESGPAAKYRRTAVEGIMDSSGVVPSGVVGPDLLAADPEAPFGVRYDNAAVLDAFAAVWTPGSVVLVEGSDLVRESAYRGLAEAGERAQLFADALASTDDLIGLLLEQVDLERDIVLVVGPTHPRSEVRLTLAALHAPGLEPGLLRSASTRRPGFAELVDIAPTILDQLAIPRPDSMEGRALEVGAEGGSASDRREFLADADADSTAREELVGPVAIVFVAVGGILIAATVLILRRASVGRPPLANASVGWRATTAVRFGALLALTYVPAVLLAQLLPVRRSGPLVFFLFVVGAAVVLALAVELIGRHDPVTTLILGLALIVGLLLVDVVIGAPMQFNSALGYSPKVGGRFTGFGNLGYAALTSAALLLAGLVCHRVGARLGILAATAILVVVFLADAAPFWGADVGGVLSVLPAYVVTVYVLLERRVRIQTAVLCVVGAVAAVGVLGLIDLARPSADRSHLGRLFERITDEGWSALMNVIERKIVLNLETVTTSVWTLLVVFVVGFCVWLARRQPWCRLEIERRIPETRAVLSGLAVLLVLGYALNDSGIVVPGLMLGIFNAVVVSLVVWVVGDRSPSDDGQPDDGLTDDGIPDRTRPEREPQPVTTGDSP